MSLRVPSAEATIGPFFPQRYIDPGANDLTSFEGRKARGEAIEIHGRVLQEGGQPLENLVLEVWQADAAGVYRHPADPKAKDADPNFFGWGRVATKADGSYSFKTVKPGARDGRAPHINVLVMFSGIMRILHTTLYFEGEQVNDADAVLGAVPAARRQLLVARHEGNGKYRFDIRLRGEHETPFFEE